MNIVRRKKIFKSMQLASELVKSKSALGRLYLVLSREFITKSMSTVLPYINRGSTVTEEWPLFLLALFQSISVFCGIGRKLLVPNCERNAVRSLFFFPLIFDAAGSSACM